MRAAATALLASAAAALTLWKAALKLVGVSGPGAPPAAGAHPRSATKPSETLSTMTAGAVGAPAPPGA
jgi:hypothetical protein